MDPILLIMLVFLLALFSGMPVAFAMLLAAEFYFLILQPDLVLTVIAQRNVGMVGQSFTLLAIPLFLLAGQLLNDAGMTQRLVAFAQAVVGHIRGGVGHAVIMANVVMGGMSGSAVADAAGIGSMMIPAMERSGYSKGTSAALSASAAIIGPIIPPSIAMVIYSSLVGTSLGKLLLAGILPGLLLGFLFMVGLFFDPEARGVRRGQFSWRQVMRTGKDAVFAGLMPIIILGGMFTGVYTPTEGAAVAVVYSLVIGIVVYRTLTPAIIYRALARTAITTGVVLVIIASAAALGWIMAVEDAGQFFGRIFQPLAPFPGFMLLGMSLLIVALGSVVEDTTLMVLLGPIFAPIAVAAGIDPVQFGLVFVLATLIGVITPPVGMTLYVTSAIAGISVGEFSRHVWRQVVVLVVTIILLSFIPAISTLIPNLVFPP